MFYFSKYISLLLFAAAVFLAAVTVTAQTPGPGLSDTYKDFIANRTYNNYKTQQQTSFICSLPFYELKKLVADKKIILQRSLNDSVFIISGSSTIDTGLPFHWIKKASPNWKLSPPLLAQQKKEQLYFPALFLIQFKQAGQLPIVEKQKDLAVKASSAKDILIVTIKTKTAFDELLLNDQVIFIAAYDKHPIEEQQINDLDLSVNKINQLHNALPLLNGEGITISIKENLPDTTDIDFSARYKYSSSAATSVSSHASIMATMAAGAGNSWYLGKGVATAANITSSDFSNLLPDSDESYRQSHITIQNHSYGVGIENFYGADAAAYDASAIKNDSILFVFSAGNFGTLAAPATGAYPGIPGYANISGSFKMAKNIITVGAVDSFETVARASSRGPAFDGRIKPEIVAYGEDGTSGSAALVSGTAAVLQQAYANTHGGKIPPAALIKAILLNSADDVAAAGIDYTSGYGNLNTKKAADDLLAGTYFSGIVANSTSQEFILNIPAGIRNAKLLLVWNDPPALPNSNKAIVNDLDIELWHSPTNQSWKPWVLDSDATADSLSAPPSRKRDSLNTTEQITLANPAAGEYKIVVTGHQVTGAGQSFFVAYQLDTVNHFSWNFPSATDNIFPDTTNILRWSTDSAVNNARLFYSLNRGADWQPIDSLINTQKKYFYWNAPDTNVLAMLKMQINKEDFISDTFTISHKTTLTTGLNCADSVLFSWNKLAGIQRYQLFTLQDKYLQPFYVVSDTQVVFKKTDLPSSQFAVAPVIEHTTGVKSYTKNYTLQGAGCYINNLIADIQNDHTVLIQLQTGTVYRVKKIVFEKLVSGTFTAIKEFSNIGTLNFTTTDKDLLRGTNTYRVRIELADGRLIYSLTTSVFYFKNEDIIVYPSPVAKGHFITVQMSALQNQLLKVTDTQGRTVYTSQANSTVVKIPVSFASGMYFLTIINAETGSNKVVKILVQ